MATYSVADGYFTNIANIDFSVLFYGVATIHSKKMFVLEFAEGWVDFRGTGFQYNKQGVPVGGDVEGYSVYIGGEKALSFGGFDVPVKNFVKVASTISQVDDQKLLAQMLAKNDTIIGADQADGLVGYAGKDVMYGAGGADYLRGGAGADRFVYYSTWESTSDESDTIFDFSRAQRDKIDLSEMGAYHFGGEGEFTGSMGEVMFFRYDGQTYVAADTDGDIEADFVLILKGEMQLTAGDFIL